MTDTLVQSASVRGGNHYAILLNHHLVHVTRESNAETFIEFEQFFVSWGELVVCKSNPSLFSPENRSVDQVKELSSLLTR
jgi:hypothetical protein